MNNTTDETQSLLDKNRQTSTADENILDPLRTIGTLVNGQRGSGPNNNNGFIPHTNGIRNGTSSTRPANYGYLEHIQSLKPFMKSDDKSLPKKVRQYYTDQMNLIKSIEDAIALKTDETKDNELTRGKRLVKRADLLSKATLITNIILVIIKIVGAVLSNSLSVLSSVVDSVVDLLINIILIWTARKIKNYDVYKYPRGRARLEPISVIIFSVIMCSASVIIIFKSIQTLDQDANYFKNRYKPSSTLTLPYIDMSAMPIIAMVLTIISKAILFFLCYRINTPTMRALAEDNRNDVVSNSVALVCGSIGSNAWHRKISQQAIVVDPIGAILISIYIIIAWILQANRQVRHLTGISADPLDLQRITHVVYNYRPDVVTKIDSIQAVHLGTDLVIEADIALPGSMPLSEAHHVGTELRSLLETLSDVEKAFVHLDFEFDHTSAVKNKTV